MPAGRTADPTAAGDEEGSEALSSKIALEQPCDGGRGDHRRTEHADIGSETPQ